MIERNIATTTHGRYLLVPVLLPPCLPACWWDSTGMPKAPNRSLNAFARFQGRIDGSGVGSGPPPLYQRRTNEVIASWMTRQDRELAIGRQPRLRESA